MRSLAIALAILGLGLASCGSKEDASLSVYAQNPVVKKTANPFGFKLEGSVDVVFDEGAYSQGSVTVDNVSLRLFRGTNTVVLPRAKIELTAASPHFPLTIAAGEKKTTSWTIAIDQLTADEITELCAGPVSVSGTVDQQGKHDPTRVATTPVAPQGCP